jgi:hypothetical protein
VRTRSSLGPRFLWLFSANTEGSRVAGCVLMFFLAVFSICSNGYLRALNLGFLALLACLLVIDIYTKYEPLWYVTLFVGVMSCLFALFDVCDELLASRSNESDAAALAKLTRGTSRCWGFILGLLALGALAVAVYLHLQVAKREGGPVKLGDTATSTQVMFGFTIAAIAAALVHTVMTKQVMVPKCTFCASERDNGNYACVV